MLLTSLGLKKPEGTDPVNVQDFNENTDVIERELQSRPKKNGAADEMTVAFTEPAALAELTGGDTLKGLFGKLKLTVKNVISILKLLGTADISTVGDGTVTGAIGTLNSNLAFATNHIGFTLLQANPNAFQENALSVSYIHGSELGIDTGYIPVLTTRWYQNDDNVLACQIAVTKNGIRSRYSISETAWSPWNGNLDVHTVNGYSFNSEAEINNFYNTCSQGLNGGTFYRFRVSHNIDHSVLGGGIYGLEGQKVDELYEYQVIRSYNGGIGIREFSRSKHNGIWYAWQQIT